MKKLFQVLGSVTVFGTSVSTLVACNVAKDKDINKDPSNKGVGIFDDNKYDYGARNPNEVGKMKQHSGRSLFSDQVLTNNFSALAFWYYFKLIKS